MTRQLLYLSLACTAGVTLLACEGSGGPSSPGSLAAPMLSETPDLSAESFSGYAGAGAPSVTATLNAPGPSILANGSLTFFTDRSAFDAEAPDLPLEDFEGSNVSAGAIVACDGAFNSATDNACYSPGAIVEGISVAAVGIGQMVVLAQGALGVPSTVVGPNFFNDDTDIMLSAGNVTAVGLDLLAPIHGPGVITIQIFGAGDVLLGTTTATTGRASGAFWGVVSEDVITRLRLSAPDAFGELIDDVAFGEAFVRVVIDIKPGSDPNSINPTNLGVIPVAILTTSAAAGDARDFDAADVDASTVAFGANGAAEAHGMGHMKDVDGDGDMDMVLHFRTQQTGIACGDTEATLTGRTLAGRRIKGTDAVNTVGCKNTL